MNIKFCVYVQSILALCLILSNTMASEEVNIVRGNNKFGMDVFKITSRNEGNVLISPFSAHMVLSMAYHGACGDTETILQKTLGLPEAHTTSLQYRKLIGEAKQINSVTLDVANKIYVMQQFKLYESFESVLQNYYLAEAQEVNFVENQKSAAIINSWVKENTKGKITELIDSSMLGPPTRLVLVNAVYFKGTWAKQFNKNSTRKEPFYLLNGDEVNVDMMHLENKFRYLENEDLNCKILELPYEGNEMSMIIFLPNERNGIVELQDKLTNVNISDVTKNLDLLTVNVALPKFKIESTIPLKPILSEMGLGIIFSDNANFCKMAEKGEELKVSDVVQKTFIEVNEEGAEAAAATGLVMMMRCMPIPERKVLFEADHPFLVAIIHKADENNILFFGRLSSPVTA